MHLSRDETPVALVGAQGGPGQARARGAAAWGLLPKSSVSCPVVLHSVDQQQRPLVRRGGSLGLCLQSHLLSLCRRQECLLLPREVA